MPPPSTPEALSFWFLIGALSVAQALIAAGWGVILWLVANKIKEHDANDKELFKKTNELSECLAELRGEHHRNHNDGR